MECVLLGTPEQTRLPALLMENADEKWRCTPVSDPGAVPALASDVLVLFPGEGAQRLLSLFISRPPVLPPYIVSCAWAPEACDLSLEAEALCRLPAMVESLEQAGTLPFLCQRRLDALTELAGSLLRALEIRAGLHAWRFLPDMAALITVHPSLLSSLSLRLYPLVARRHGMSPAAVERSLRLAVESAWTRSSLDALERFFGQSIDPQRGKPTNREFLFCIADHLTLAARRMA